MGEREGTKEDIYLYERERERNREKRGILRGKKPT